uniref:CRC domain-containing protein n=1 Tax=Timema douglasi TaxID=61478 RepID=A0A7R8VJA1_TIMDO|nr:unnamed protein product [Timema douglasi]
MSAHTGLRMPIVYCFSLGGAELEPWSLGSVENKSSRNVYCDCFANGEFCHMCNCNNCYNNLEHEEDRQRAIKSCLERNSNAFRPKIGKGVVGDERRHNKGCNCKRSGCLKNYCECYEAKISCSHNCKCIGCRNVEELCEKKTLRDLADAAEARVQQHVAVKSKLSAHIESIASRSNTASGANQSGDERSSQQALPGESIVTGVKGREVSRRAQLLLLGPALCDAVRNL